MLFQKNSQSWREDPQPCPDEAQGHATTGSTRLGFRPQALPLETESVPISRRSLDYRPVAWRRLRLGNPS